jgi:hypothetical protein
MAAAPSIRMATMCSSSRPEATQSAQASVGYATYVNGFFATELLTKASGVASLTAYWAKIGAGTPWRDAFQQTFGRSVDQFYDEFAAYKTSL